MCFQKLGKTSDMTAYYTKCTAVFFAAHSKNRKTTHSGWCHSGSQKKLDFDLSEGHASNRLKHCKNWGTVRPPHVLNRMDGWMDGWMGGCSCIVYNLPENTHATICDCAICENRQTCPAIENKKENELGVTNCTSFWLSRQNVRFHILNVTLCLGQFYIFHFV